MSGKVVVNIGGPRHFGISGIVELHDLAFCLDHIQIIFMLKAWSSPRDSCYWYENLDVIKERTRKTRLFWRSR